jgi:hypothetical protein
VGVLDNQPAALNQWALYGGALAWRGKVMGGVPKNTRVIEGWLRARAGISEQEELRQSLARTALDMGLDVKPGMSYDDLVTLTDKEAETKQTNGFKRGAQGLYIESRQLKAALKESTNILFSAQRWGPTKKGFRSMLAERVFVYPHELFLHAEEPTGIEMTIGHLNGPQGPRSSLGYCEYVVGAHIDFQVLVLEDALSNEQWVRIWNLCQQEGLGAKRSAGYGEFDLTCWDKLGHPTAEQWEEIMRVDRMQLSDEPLLASVNGV